MGLSTLAENLQKERKSYELTRLRFMRKFIRENDDAALNKRFEKVNEMDEHGFRESPEGQYKMVKAMKEIHRDAELRRLYAATLVQAAKRERDEPGGGASFYRENKKQIEAVEEIIGREAKQWERMQVRLSDLEEDCGEGNGDESQGNGKEIEAAWDAFQHVAN